MAERRKPFVAYMHKLDAANGLGDVMAGYIYSRAPDDNTVPVVVTPLEPGDPKVRETWERDGRDAVILTPPFTAYVNDPPRVAVLYQGSVNIMWLSDLRPKPVLTTWRLKVEAESREAAVAKLVDAKLADMLEEVE